MTKQVNYYFSKINVLIGKIFWGLVALTYNNRKNISVENIIIKNRIFLEKSSSLISDKEYQSNNYGIPKKNYKFINSSLTNDLTNIDMIIYLISSLKKDKLNYLEIGASVLKTFMSIENSFINYNMVAYDINPIVNKYANEFLVKNTSSKLHTSSKFDNNLFYFQGDVLNKDDTKDFSSSLDFKYDFIFSDALHTKEGIDSEFDNIIQDKLAENFMIYYDDLDIKWAVPTVEPGVIESFQKLKAQNHNVYLYTFWIYGWLGKNENMHKNAIITNFEIDSVLEKLKLPFLKKFN